MKVRARLSLRRASLLPSRKQLVVFLREILAQTERTTTRANAGSTSERRWWKSSKNRFIVSNNVGVEGSLKYFSYQRLMPFGALGGRRTCRHFQRLPSRAERISALPRPTVHFKPGRTVAAALILGDAPTEAQPPCRSRWRV